MQVKHGAFQAAAMAGAKALWQHRVWVFRKQQEGCHSRKRNRARTGLDLPAAFWSLSFILEALGSHWGFQLRKE